MVSSGSAMGSSSKDKAMKAMAAMSDMGFPRRKTRLVLKQLLRTCENKWQCIEEENYRLLVEAIVESEEPEVEDPKEKKNGYDSLHSKRKEASQSEEHESYRTRLRQRKEEGQLSTSVQGAGTSSMGSSPQKNLALQSDLKEESRPVIKRESVSEDTSPEQDCGGPLALYPYRQEKRVAAVAQQEVSVIGKLKEHSLVTCQKRNLICSKKPEFKVTRGSASENAMVFNEDLDDEPSLDPMPGGATLADKDVQIIGEPVLFEVPLAIIRPRSLGTAIKEGPPSNHPDGRYERILPSVPSVNSLTSELNASSPAQVVNEKNGERSLSVVRNEDGANDKLTNVVESPSNSVEIASSANAEAKVLLSYNVVDCPNFQMPSLESVMKKVEDKCLRSYKILDPSFSVMNIMKELCNTLLEMGTESVKDKQEDLVIVRTASSLGPSKFPSIVNPSGDMYARSASISSGLRLPQVPELMAMDGLKHITQLNLVDKGSSEIGSGAKGMYPQVLEPSHSLVLFRQHEAAFGDIRPVHDTNDITKGEERVRISVVNEVSSEQYPPYFSYIPHNIVYQHAHLNFSLARIGDEDCCSDCFGDCLSVSIPCECTHETNGVYAYTLDGLLKEEFLDECISMKHEPKKHQLFYCKDCPPERAKNEVKPEHWTGHLVTKFIKECWSKCGCNKECGNRVVQRGITCNLQVFFTPEGKGWGLRALDDLPKGTFVCEYVGEVLTNMELYDRTIESTGNAKHTYPVLLDAVWGSEGILRDEEALCLDATFYGNVARFINHRCGDANLVEVPVEVETPDRHYYHLAFFAARKVEAFEELTWDYAIDFDDEDHPVKGFRCRCGSKLCRDRKHQNSKYVFPCKPPSYCCFRDSHC